MVDSKGGFSAVLWWVGWITLTVVSFFICSWFWTGFIAKHVGPVSQPGVSVLWVAAVFGSWMVLLVPLIVMMYNKVDRVYEDARIKRETRQFEQVQGELGVRCENLDESQRFLSEALQEKVKQLAPAIKKGHLVSLELNDGRRVPYAFIREGRELQGIYGQQSAGFTAADIRNIEPVDLDKLPVFEESQWLRLDGVGIPVYNG